MHAAAMLAILGVMDSIRLDSHSRPIYFLADLHLDEKRPQAIAAFIQFLTGPAREASALFILGDLFEAWIGDDARPEHDPVAPALARLSQQGTAVYLMHGNRDFLLGERFATAASAELIEEPCLISIDSEPVLLEHGDALCVDDLAYQAFRQQVRDPAWQAEFLSLPIEARIRQAQDARVKSGEAMAGKTSEIMDVNAEAVVERLRTYDVRRLIHGHTHRPAVHTLMVDGEPATRIVLGDWFEQASILRVSNGDYSLRTINLGPTA